MRAPRAPDLPVARSASVSVDAIVPEYWSEWTYRVPEELRGEIADGQLVWVPLRDRVVLGIVAALAEQPAKRRADRHMSAESVAADRMDERAVEEKLRSGLPG